MSAAEGHALLLFQERANSRLATSELRKGSAHVLP